MPSPRQPATKSAVAKPRSRTHAVPGVAKSTTARKSSTKKEKQFLSSKYTKRILVAFFALYLVYFGIVYLHRNQMAGYYNQVLDIYEKYDSNVSKEDMQQIDKLKLKLRPTMK